MGVSLPDIPSGALYGDTLKCTVTTEMGQRPRKAVTLSVPPRPAFSPQGPGGESFGGGGGPLGGIFSFKEGGSPGAGAHMYRAAAGFMAPSHGQLGDRFLTLIGRGEGMTKKPTWTRRQPRESESGCSPGPLQDPEERATPSTRTPGTRYSPRVSWCGSGR